MKDIRVKAGPYVFHKGQEPTIPVEMEWHLSPINE